MQDESLLLPFRLRTVRVGVGATLLAVAMLAAYPHLPGAGRVLTGPYYATLAVALVAVTGVAILPWGRLFRGGYGIRLLYVWSVGDIVLVSAVVAFSGGARSDLWAVYVLTTVFFAASYPRRSQIALYTATVVAYVSACTGAGPVVVADMALRSGILGVLTIMASFLSHELMSEMEQHHREREESARRAELLASVASAGRAVTAVDPAEILEAVAATCVGIGFDVGGIGRVDEDTGTYEVLAARGVPDTYRMGSHSLSDSVVGRAAETGRTVVVDAARPGRLRNATGEYHAAVAVPVLLGERSAAVVGVARVEPTVVTPQEIEAVELLAALTGRALENASLFEMKQRAIDRLERLDRLKRDFLSNVSHELRTPLTVIYAMGQTLLKKWTRLDDEQRQVGLDRVVANAASLDRTIKALLDFSRVEAGRLEARPERVEVAPFVNEQIHRLTDLLAPRTVDVEVEDGVCAHMDPLLAERALENLLVNAAIHTPPDTHIRVSAGRVVDGIEFAVSDDGPGIPAEEVDHLTDRFFRGGDPDTRSTRGLGLGLALVQEILAAHGTTLVVSSGEGDGACFSFRLAASSSGPGPATDVSAGEAVLPHASPATHA